MNEVYIFDIDGCIMPPIISNFDENGEPREKIVNEAKNIGRKIKLFSNFINYYAKSCKRAKSVFFITGRKYSEFGKLTESKLNLLKRLRAFQIIFYPEGKVHESDEYFEWKSDRVQKIINNHINRNNRNSVDKDYRDNTVFHIFDDMNDYFPKIKEFSETIGLEVNLSLITGEKSWNSFLNETIDV